MQGSLFFLVIIVISRLIAISFTEFESISIFARSSKQYFKIDVISPDIEDELAQETTTVTAELDGDLEQTLDAPETMQMELEGGNYKISFKIISCL